MNIWDVNVKCYVKNWFLCAEDNWSFQKMSNSNKVQHYEQLNIKQQIIKFYSEK